MDLIAPFRSVLTAKALDYSDDEQKIFVSTIAKRVVLRTQPATDIEGLPQGHFDWAHAATF